MNTRDILKNIPNDTGAGYFKVYLPTINKELRIKHLSVSDQKIISKLSIDDSGSTFASESDLAKISIAEVNSLENIDITNIDARDYFILCCAFRKENYLTDFTVEYTCPTCNETLSETIDFSRLVEAATEFDNKFKEEIIKTAAGDARITIGLPKQIDLIMLEMYYSRVAKTRDVTPAEKYIDYVICCMSNIQFKDDNDEWQDTEDFINMDYIKKVDFIQSIKADIEAISKLFENIGLITSKFFYDIKCPSCDSSISTFVGTSDFFML